MAEAIRVTYDMSGFGDFERAALDAIEKAGEHAADAIVDQAQAQAPVLTGFLRDNISARSLVGLEWEVESAAPYSSVNEFGSAGGRPGRPFFTPAVEAERARFAERIAKALAEAEKG